MCMCVCVCVSVCVCVLVSRYILMYEGTNVHLNNL